MVLSLIPRKEFVAESRQAKKGTETQMQPQSATPTQIQQNAQTQSKSGTIPPCPKSLEVSPSDLLDEDEKVLKFDTFVNECLNKEDKGSR